MRILAVMVAAGTLSFFSMPKDAEAVSLNLINTWRMTDLWGANALGGNNLGGAAAGPAAWTNGSFPESGVNIHFGIGFGKGDQIVPFLGLGMERRNYYWDFDNADDVGGSALQFGLEVGGKFFFIERSKGKAPPFVMVSFYKYFGSVNDDAHSDDDEAQYLVEHMGALGFKFSFGAEYYFNDNFALGADFLGLNFSTVTANHADLDDLVDARNQFSLYSGLTLTYRFSFTVRASVQFEADYDYED